MSQEKKIIVDEDWKTQVQAEKETLKKEGPAQTPAAKSAPAAATASAPQESSKEPDAEEFELPPASFPFLLTTLATQAFVALGQIANPLTGEVEIRPDQARHIIDTLAMLQDKTTGNLSPDEATMLDHLLHELRMIFVTGQTSEQRARAAEPPPV